MKHQVITIFVIVWFFAFNYATYAQSFTARESQKMTKTLVDWLECEECGEVELKEVVRYGDAIVLRLAAVLQHGASPASRAIEHHELNKRYDRLSADRSSKQILSRKKFVQTYLDNYDLMYRSKATLALKKIGTAKAMKVLKGIGTYQ